MQAPPPEEELGRRSILWKGTRNLAGNKGVITGPALACDIDGYPDGPSHVVCNGDLGQIKLKDDSSGLGGELGWGAFGEPPVRWGELYYCYYPEYPGRLTVIPSVHVRGGVYVSSRDWWLSSSHADLRLTLKCHIFQYSLANSLTTMTVVDESGGDFRSSYWIDAIYGSDTPNTATVDTVGGVFFGLPYMPWVIIAIRAELYAYARSAFATATADFFSGPDRFIHVTSLETQLEPRLRP